MSIMKELEHWGLRPLSIKGLTYIAILMAIEIVLNKFQFQTSYLEIGFGFIAVAFIAWWFGPFWSTIVAILVDVLTSIINGYGFFIGFTFSGIIAALIFSFAFYNQEKVSWLRVIVAVVLITLIVNIGLNTLWISVMAHTSFFYYLPLRLVNNIIMIPIQIIILYILMNNKTIQHFKPNVFK
ncbi:hypothetical protein IV37_GL000277 [Fructilactobacillus fructivorans]|nr:hypothetical protein IV37_GL000277 [Fructilactobacillus fructivorans]